MEEVGVAKRYLDRAEVARILCVSPETVTRWAKEGRLPYVLTLGGRHRFDPEEIERLARELRLLPPSGLPPGAETRGGTSRGI